MVVLPSSGVKSKEKPPMNNFFPRSLPPYPYCLALKNLDSKTQGYVKKNDINKAKATLQLHDSRLIKTSNCSPVHYKSAHKEESSYRI